MFANMAAERARKNRKFGALAYQICDEPGLARFGEIARSNIVGDTRGLMKLLFHRGTGRLLGVHILGEGAAELVHIGQAVLAFGGGRDYFLETVFNYPTLAECYKVAAMTGSDGDRF